MHRHYYKVLQLDEPIGNFNMLQILTLKVIWNYFNTLQILTMTLINPNIKCDSELLHYATNLNSTNDESCHYT